ncbi:hypothetical protein SAMN05421772_11733 [Paracoccus saliphilus]|uniref:Uncharacterized protein n=1 Tax=Paracoccus saliphilus TaxID=405559 RepID=A0AA45W7F0_9RHOB|nr:hypothetical protein SAMN05421772_11733 [Paracoccus saliphilus]
MTKAVTFLAVYMLSAFAAVAQSTEERSEWDRALEICAATKLAAGCQCIPHVDEEYGPQGRIECEDDGNGVIEAGQVVFCLQNRHMNRKVECTLGSGLVHFHSQKMIVAASAMADKKTLGHLS